jgi:hypothetical protein
MLGATVTWVSKSQHLRTDVLQYSGLSFDNEAHCGETVARINLVYTVFLTFRTSPSIIQDYVNILFLVKFQILSSSNP